MLGRDRNLACVAGRNPTLAKTTRGIFNVNEAWHSSNTVHTKCSPSGFPYYNPNTPAAFTAGGIPLSVTWGPQGKQLLKTTRKRECWVGTEISPALRAETLLLAKTTRGIFNVSEAWHSSNTVHTKCLPSGFPYCNSNTPRLSPPRASPYP